MSEAKRKLMVMKCWFSTFINSACISLGVPDFLAQPKCCVLFSNCHVQHITKICLINILWCVLLLLKIHNSMGYFANFVLIHKYLVTIPTFNLLYSAYGGLFSVF